MKSWVREPLLHFFLAAGLVFLAYEGWGRGDRAEPDVVRVTAAEVDWLRATWTRQRQRPPDDAELRGIVAEYVREELLAREARDLGLDEDDTVVRRRLAQKMEFLVADTAQLAEPAEGELRQFYEAQRDRYRSAARLWLTQVYFRGEAAARRALRDAEGGALPESGEPSLLESDYAGIDEAGLASLFGADFARRAFGLEPGAWQGPIASSYGFHLVRVGERRDAEPRSFEEARPQVLDEWHARQRARAMEQFLAGLTAKYRIVVDDGAAAPVGPLAGALP